MEENDFLSSKEITGPTINASSADEKSKKMRSKEMDGKVHRLCPKLSKEIILEQTKKYK